MILQQRHQIALERAVRRDQPPSGGTDMMDDGGASRTSARCPLHEKALAGHVADLRHSTGLAVGPDHDRARVRQSGAGAEAGEIGFAAQAMRVDGSSKSAQMAAMFALEIETGAARPQGGAGVGEQTCLTRHQSVAKERMAVPHGGRNGKLDLPSPQQIDAGNERNLPQQAPIHVRLLPRVGQP
jgi:hypothetical protein